MITHYKLQETFITRKPRVQQTDWLWLVGRWQAYNMIIPQGQCFALILKHDELLLNYCQNFLSLCCVQPLVSCKMIFSRCLCSILQPNVYNVHCVKSAHIQSYPGPYFPAFGLNLSLRIQSECGKIQTRITPNTDIFLVVVKFPLHGLFCIR